MPALSTYLAPTTTPFIIGGVVAHHHAPKGLDLPWTSTYKYRKVLPQQPQYVGVSVSQERPLPLPLSKLFLTFPLPSSISPSPRQTACSSAITMSFPPVIKLNDGNEIPAVCFSPPILMFDLKSYHYWFNSILTRLAARLWSWNCQLQARCGTFGRSVDRSHQKSH